MSPFPPAPAHLHLHQVSRGGVSCPWAGSGKAATNWLCRGGGCCRGWAGANLHAIPPDILEVAQDRKAITITIQCCDVKILIARKEVIKEREKHYKANNSDGAKNKKRRPWCSAYPWEGTARARSVKWLSSKSFILIILLGSYNHLFCRGSTVLRSR